MEIPTVSNATMYKALTDKVALTMRTEYDITSNRQKRGENGPIKKDGVQHIRDGLERQRSQIKQEEVAHNLVKMLYATLTMGLEGRSLSTAKESVNFPREDAKRKH